MRSPVASTHALSRAWIPPAIRLATFLALLAAPVLAHATHYLVDSAGGGDFTTIQGAVDALASSPRDSILVRPGFYPESVLLPASAYAALVAVAGPDSTTVHTIQSNGGGSVSGFAFDALHHQLQAMRYDRCLFLQGFEIAGAPTGATMTNSEVHGPSTSIGVVGEGYVGVRFVNAPLFVATNGGGTTRFRNCTFSGGTDTLVVCRPASGDDIGFRGCEFSDAAVGVAARPSLGGYVGIASCSFHDLGGDAICTSGGGPYTPLNPAVELDMVDSRIERCGTGVRWTPGNDGRLSMVRDSVFDSRGDALVLSVGEAAPGLDHVIVMRSGGHGCVIERRPPTLYHQTFEFQVGIQDSYFADNAGDGVRVVHDWPAQFAAGGHSFLTNSTAERNGGAGFRLEGGAWTVERNVARANAGTGLEFTSLYTADHLEGLSGFRPDSVIFNTSVGNGDAGIVVSRAEASGPYTQAIQHNLCVANHGNGLIVAATSGLSCAYNDAWHNLAADYLNVSSPADSNLGIDPRFCDLSAGQLTLAFGSPCGAGGPYGAIGARPEACASAAGVVVPPPAVAFSARPNPARGAVEFALPAGVSGRLEVIDVAGRAVWSRNVHAGETVRWNGETSAGHARAGLYWARFVRPGRVDRQRLVWLE